MANRRLWAALALALALGWTTGAEHGGATSQSAEARVTIQGSVVDERLTPIAGVRVTLERQGAAAVAQTTDESGRFTFDRVVPGAYTVKAELRGFKPWSKTLAVRASPAPLQIPIVMWPTTPRPARARAEERASAAGGGGVVGGVLGGVARDAVAAPTPPATAAPAAAQAMIAGWPYAASNREGYAHIVSNQFKLATVEPLSTFAADVDTASFTNVRRFLTTGRLPPPDAVRVEELINYFRFRYPEPTGQHPVSITTEVGDAPWAPGHKLVLVGLRAKPIVDREVPRRNIVLLVDVSGSMAPPDRLPLVKTALRMFVDTLRDEDRISIVVYAGASGLALPATSGRFRQRIHDAIEGLNAGGSTNGAEGLVLAYRTAREEFVPGGINRVILATDGDFNVGVTSDGDLVRLIERERESGVFLSVLGVGTGNLQDAKMEQLADKGNGHYAYLDSLFEARRVLVREGGATLETVAKDVKLQVEFNPAKVAAWKLVGYENRLLAHEAFNDDTKDGGELGAGHTVTALYEIVPVGAKLPAEVASSNSRPAVDPLIYQSDRRPAGNAKADLLTVKVRYKLPAAKTSELLSRPVQTGGTTTVSLPFAAAVAEFGMLLRDDTAAATRWTDLTRRLDRLTATGDSAADREAFAELVHLAAGLRRLGR